MFKTFYLLATMATGLLILKMGSITTQPSDIVCRDYMYVANQSTHFGLAGGCEVGGRKWYAVRW